MAHHTALLLLGLIASVAAETPHPTSSLTEPLSETQHERVATARRASRPSAAGATTLAVTANNKRSPSASIFCYDLNDLWVRTYWALGLLKRGGVTGPCEAPARVVSPGATDVELPANASATESSTDFDLPVEPPSSGAVVVLNAVVVAVALVVLLNEISCPRLPWSAVRQKWTAYWAAGAHADPGRENKQPATARLVAPVDTRFWILAFNVLTVFTCDLYNSIPSAFFPGESLDAGLPLHFAGVYFGSTSILAVVTILVMPTLAAVFCLTDLMRIGLALFAVVAAPQGFANLLGTAGFAACSMTFRVLEGIPYGIIEMSAGIMVNRGFPMEEVGPAFATVAQVRILTNSFSAATGGVLYTAGGFTMPYLVPSVLGCLFVLVLRCFVERRVPSAAAMPAVEPDKTSAMEYVCVYLTTPTTLACGFQFFVVMFTFMAFNLLWEPWLGAAPYSWRQDQLATVPLCASISGAIALMLAIPLNFKIGHLGSMAVGSALVTVSLLFMGTPPTVLPTVAVAIPWLPYVVTITYNVGMNIASIPMYSIPFRAFVDATGGTMADVAVPMALVNTVIPYVANFLGPVVAGAIIETLGVPRFCFCLCCAYATSALLILLTCWYYLTTPATEGGGEAAADGAAAEPDKLT